MSDWRRNGQEKYLFGKTLYKIRFPDFWKESYASRNVFLQKIESYAKESVRKNGYSEEYLHGDKIQHFWHEHCEFCWDKALTDTPCVFYCTEDMRYWVCEECFRDFQKEFCWQEKSSDELFQQEKV